MSKFVLGFKLVELSPKLSFTQFEQWRQNVLYHLTLNENFRPFLHIKFGKKTCASPNRDLRGDVASGNVPDAEGQTAEIKCTIVDQMLEQISNWTLNIIPVSYTHLTLPTT